ncbi:hypothetical protein CFIMG_005837RA [Ceratocystis fimbriata CBS 114723]|uniref:RNA polymerase II assembly factor RTP1 n=1 Tax=Ceratocystis fimbriata CBS 114723 TaxID=1035309 RepID=A0A2C5WXI7_9PEZI|nr:hypothetical protein CFIMG_005837RA [Ceratocystis fimbriata CBS 114723]
MEGYQGTSDREDLKQKVIESGKVAFGPNNEASTQAQALKEFQDLIDKSSPWSLLPILNAAIQPGAVPDFLRVQLLAILTSLPLRPNGVRSTLEFVFAVHPSATVTAEESAQPQKQGANITTEALSAATRLLSSVPTEIPPFEWFAGIRPQLMELLDGTAGEELVKVAGHVISFGVLGRKAYGAPGAPGWEVFIAPILHILKPSIYSKITQASVKIKEELDDVVDLRQAEILSSESDIALALKRLSSLLYSSPSPGLCKRVVSHILLEMWAIASIPETKTKDSISYSCSKMARKLLAMFIQVANSKDVVGKIIENLLYNGETVHCSSPWEFKISSSSVSILSCKTKAHQTHVLDVLNRDWSVAEFKAGFLSSLVMEACTDDEVADIFLGLFRKWLNSKNMPETQTPKIMLIEERNDHGQDPDSLMRGLLEVMVIQGLMEKSSGKLVSKTSQVLDVVEQVLAADKTRPQGDEVISIVLSLLNQIITAPTFQSSSLTDETMASLREALTRFSQQSSTTTESTAQTARNLLLLLQYRDELDGEEESKPATDEQIEDRKTYSLAMSYITDGESPPPVKSEGLNMISRLILKASPIIDVLAVLVLLSRIISDNEDFLNLRAIKILALLSEKHPKTVCREILDHYLDPKEMASTDTRLRFGEALLQVIQRLGEMFTGPTATEVSETLLSIASRRGVRRKTEQRQAREERKRAMKNKEAADAWGGEVLDMSDDIPEAERLNNEILTQIVCGWESKRGSEDVRMRTSALSLFAAAMDTNLVGIGSTIVEIAIDLCISALTYEPEPEKAILRRASIVVVVAFIKALDTAKKQRRTTSLGFGLTEQSRDDIMRALKYVEGSDNDGLVREHARDAIESLESWQMISLLPETKDEERNDFGGLAGIAGNPIEMALQTNKNTTLGGRPRIEEVE